MSHNRILLGAAAVAVAVPVAALAAGGDEKVLDHILVDGFRLGQTLPEVGSSVTVITADDIAALGFGFVLDAVASAPGVTVTSNGGFGGVASVRIRGAGSEQTLVLLDGVPVNDPSAPGGGFNFARLDTANIERIEILKGAQSTFWGTDAIGGVVAITTKRQEQGVGGRVFGEYGSFDTFRGGASVGRANDWGEVRLGFSSTVSDGISKADERNGNLEDDPYRARSLFARGGWLLGSDARIDLGGQWSEADTAFDSYAAAGQGSISDGDENDETTEFTGNLRLSWPWFDGLLANATSVGYAEIERQSWADGLPTFAAEGERRIFRYQGTFAVDERSTLALGIEREETSANGDRSSLDGYFALYEAKPVPALVLTAGWRFDDHRQFDSETAGRVALAWAPNDSITLRSSWGQGFKAPTIFQRTFFCCGASEPNAGLRAERSVSFDAGMDWRSADGRTTVGATYFDQRTEDQIDFSFANGDYENIARVESRGVEIAGSYRMADWLTLGVDYAYIDAKRGTGEPLVQLPKHAGDVTVRFTPKGPFSGTVLLRHNGSEPALDGGALGSWTRVDIVGAYVFSESLKLVGRIENLFDRAYQQVLGYGTPGLSGSLGLRWRY